MLINVDMNALQKYLNPNKLKLKVVATIIFIAWKSDLRYRVKEWIVLELELLIQT